MKKNFGLFGLLIGLALFASAAAAQAVRQPRTVRDYFIALPDRFFSLDCCLGKTGRAAKEEHLKRYLNVEDAANGYLSGYGDAAQDGFAMALFKRPDGSRLIGFYTYGEGGVEDTPWCVFLDYRGGKWRDVSRAAVPRYDPARFVYELPRRGTTVEVFYKDENGDDFNKGKKAYDLVWRDGRFSVVE